MTNNFCFVRRIRSLPSKNDLNQKQSPVRPPLYYSWHSDIDVNQYTDLIREQDTKEISFHFEQNVSFMRASVLITFYTIIVLFPIGRLLTGGMPRRSAIDEIASAAGILAFAIILMEFVLSGRFRTFSDKVGMDVTMRAHQLLARVALILVLIHPFLYRAPFDYQRPWDVTRQLTLTDNMSALSSGLAAWIFLIVFIVFAIFRSQLSSRYETWRLMHGLGALLIAGFTLHHTLGAGRYSLDSVMAGYWFSMFAIAIFSLVFVYVLKPIYQLFHPWKIASIAQIAERTWEVVVEPQNETGLDYQAGQFAWLNVGNSPFSLYENPFSISSAPAAGNKLEFVIKELGDFTRSLGSIKRGTKAYVDGPHGNLIVPKDKGNGVALIAGGVGIAPLIGILREMHHENDPRQTTLIYGNRVEEQIAYRDELARISSEYGTEVVHVLSEPKPDWQGPTGMVDDTLLRSLFSHPQRKEWIYILCGPSPMLEAVEKALIALGIPKNNILSERFDYD